MSAQHRSLFEVWPSVRSVVPFEDLGQFPTPITELSGLAREAGCGENAFFLKRDDLSSSVYGGNKVRTLEVLFGLARSRDCSEVVATGAFGSNHAVATLLHAPRVGLRPRFALFPQPVSRTAAENFRVIVASGAPLDALLHWSSLPFAMWRLGRGWRAERRFVMVPGGATPIGALGYVSAAFELAFQIERNEVPEPSRILVGVGSTCTSAGLLLGVLLAHRLRIGFSRSVPRLTSVRVTPWPVTSRYRIVDLALRTARLLAALSGDSRVMVRRRDLHALLEVDGRYLGRGYGYPTNAGREAIAAFRRHGGPELDTTYSAKAAAAALAHIGSRPAGPLLFWMTKSTAPLPETGDLAPASVRATRWLDRAERLDPSSPRRTRAR